MKILVYWSIHNQEWLRPVLRLDFAKMYKLYLSKLNNVYFVKKGFFPTKLSKIGHTNTVLAAKVACFF
jgi:hypothetical protein